LFTGRGRRTQSLAQRGGGSCQAQRVLCVRLGRGGCGETFEYPRDTPLVTQSVKDLDALAVEAMRLGVVALIAMKTCQIGEDAGNSPGIPQLAKSRQALLVKRTRG